VKRLGLVVLAVVALSACAAPGPELRVAGDMHGAAGIEEFSVVADQPWSFTTVILCISDPGSVTIDSVAMDQPTGGLRVDAFATAPNPYPSAQPMRGAGPVLLPDLNEGFVLGGEPIDSVCPSPGGEQSWTGGTMLAIQVSKRSAGMGFSRAMNVTYDTQGSQRVLSIPLGIALCDQPQESPCPIPFGSD
jgi:hypothetical protein